MEILAVLVMVVGGGFIAILVVAAMTIAGRQRDRDRERTAAPQRDSIAASLLVQVLTAGGTSPDDAMRQVRRGTGIAAPVTAGIDVSNWAESYARFSDARQRQDLLEMAVRLVAAHSPISVRQYATLLDLSFGLGFRMDALARLRALYGFEYIDHAKDARPRSADRGGGVSLAPRNRDELLRILGVSGAPSRQELTTAYRKLVSQHHPDRFHASSTEAQNDAAARFIEITRAYEELLLTLRD